MEIVLASASPRRQQLLEQIGLSFRVVVTDVQENNQMRIRPEELATLHARDKALAAAAIVSENDIVIGADTIVVLEGRVFGKPVDQEEARSMLASLSGKVHEVISGVAIVKGQQIFTDFNVTEVRMRTLSAEEIKRYVDSGEPMDKAGAYGIQGLGALLVEGINGCYNNVVGLPLTTLTKLMQRVGVTLL